MGVKLKNNVAATTASDISSTATALSVVSGAGAYFPTLGAGDYFYATLRSVSGILEIVKVIARFDDTMFIVRAQEGTLAVPFPANSTIELRVTAQSITDAITDLAQIEYQTFTGNGATTTFPLVSSPVDITSTLIVVDGLVKTYPNDYTVSGAFLIFTSAPAPGTLIVARWVVAGTESTPLILIAPTQTLNFTASSNIIYPVNTSGGALTANLPAAPTQGARVGFYDAAGTWNINNLTIGRSGNNIVNVADDLIADIRWGTPMLIWDSTYGWALSP